MNKLFPDSKNPDVTSNARLAALGIRLGLTFNPSTDLARKLESSLVENHMRVVSAVPEHREFMRTHAPSEPILAEAAGRGCDVIQDGLELLEDHFGKGVLARGERGEALGRLFWTGAHDRALEEPRPAGFIAPRFHLPVKVINLLKHLLNPALHDIVLKAKPVGNPDGLELQAAFKNSYVFFSHFALADGQMLCADDMYTALLRGMALYGQATQRSIDAVIPIHMGETTREISPGTTSAINIQFKNRDDCRTVCIDRSITVPNKEIPTLSVIMELEDPRVEEGNKPKLVEVQGPAIIPKLKAKSESSRSPHDESQEDNHYSIDLYGHGPETYSMVPEEKRAVCDRILAMGDLMKDFPRPGRKDNVAFVHGMKPCFEGGDDSHTFDWFERG